MLTALQAVIDQNTSKEEGIIGLKKKYTPAIESIKQRIT